MQNIQFPFGNPTDYYVAKSYLYKNGIFGKATESYMVCYQDTTEEITSFERITEAYEFINNHTK